MWVVVMNNNNEKVFKQRLDLYWQSISSYAIIMVVYSIIKGSIEAREFSMTLQDPIVILLQIFIIITSVALLFQAVKGRTVIFGKDHIVFKSRLGEKKYNISDISSLFVSKQNFKNKIPTRNRLFKMRIKNRRRLIRIRPSSFHNDAELLESLLNLKKRIAKS